MSTDAQATLLLKRLQAGDESAAAELLPLVYRELHGLAERQMRGERRDHTLQATALVNEAWLRLVDGASAGWEGRAHFLRTAARAMRHVLVDHARARGADKRGGDRKRVPLDDALALYQERAVDLLALDEALSRLARADERLARLVELRFFGGLTIPETARVMELSTPTVERGWRAARLWLRAAVEGRSAAGNDDDDSHPPAPGGDAP